VLHLAAIRNHADVVALLASRNPCMIEAKDNVRFIITISGNMQSYTIYGNRNIRNNTKIK